MNTKYKIPTSNLTTIHLIQYILSQFNFFLQPVLIPNLKKKKKKKKEIDGERRRTSEKLFYAFLIVCPTSLLFLVKLKTILV